MNLTFADILQLITTLVMASGLYVVYRKLPGELKQSVATAAATEASTAQDAAETETIGIANQGGIFEMYKKVTEDYGELSEKLRTQRREIIDLSEKFDILKASFKSVQHDLELMTQRASTAEAKVTELERLMTERAEAAGKKVDELEQRLIDYPGRVVQLEKIIEELKAEIVRLQGSATSNEASRQLEAETASILANAAALSAAPQQPPTIENDDAQQQPTDKAATANTVAITELPTTIEVVQKPPETTDKER